MPRQQADRFELRPLSDRGLRFVRRVRRTVTDPAGAAWPDMAIWTAEVIERILREPRHGAADPADLAWAIVAGLSHYLGGTAFRIPSQARLERVARDLAIYRAFDGRNIHALAERYHLDRDSIYRIIRAQRERHLQRLSELRTQRRAEEGSRQDAKAPRG